MYFKDCPVDISSRKNSLILLEVSLVLLACVKFPPVVAPSSDAAEAPRKLATILRQPSCLSAVLTMASSYRNWDSTLDRKVCLKWIGMMCQSLMIINMIILIHRKGIVELDTRNSITEQLL